ncbi:MAG: methyltransferase [Clostridia bacterium]|nr:methyltransferase [Clostridia bacterium]
MEQSLFKLESIGNGVHIYTDALHGFGTDAVLLADFAAPKKSDIACDLGSGCGIIPFLWARYEHPQHTTAVELQPAAVELMQKSIAHNAVQASITAVQADLREIEAAGLALYSFSLVTMNPPYFAQERGYQNEAESLNMARHDVTCTTEDVITCADKLLRYGGRLCLCHKPERLADIICTMRAYAIEPKKLRFVSGKKGKAPYLVLIEGRKGGGKALEVLPELAVQNADGSRSDEMRAIYQDYGDGTKQ